MKKLFKKTALMYLITQGGMICSLAIMITLISCSFKVSNNLLDSGLLKEFGNDETVIEISYNENVLKKLVESEKKTDSKIKEEKEPVKEEPAPVVEESAPVVEQPAPVVEEPAPVVEQPAPVYYLTEQTNSELGGQISNFALQFVGSPYAYGGTSLTGGADCSGFVMAVFSNFGISLPRTATDQSYSGTPVSLDYLQPGDLIFYGYGSICHVGIYIGNGQIVHAMNESMGINISSYSFMPIVTAVRVI